MTNSAAVDIPDEARVSVGRQAIEVFLAMGIALPLMVLCNARLLAFLIVFVQNTVGLLGLFAMGHRMPAQRRWERFQHVLFGASIAVVWFMFFPADQPLMQGIRPLSTLLSRLGH